MRKNQGKQVLNVREIAEELGVFPMDVEEAVKELLEQGKVKCYMAKGEIYVEFMEGASMEDIESYDPMPLGKDDVMYR